MGWAIAFDGISTGPALRRLARSSKIAPQARRLLALGADLRWRQSERGGGEDPPMVAYVYAADRKAERPVAQLGDFTGILQVDRYGG